MPLLRLLPLQLVTLLRLLSLSLVLLQQLLPLLLVQLLLLQLLAAPGIDVRGVVHGCRLQPLRMQLRILQLPLEATNLGLHAVELVGRHGSDGKSGNRTTESVPPEARKSDF